jgi:hypothetical protein
VPSVTTDVALAELFAVNESLAAPTVVVSVMMVPCGVPPLTCTTVVNVALEPAPRLPMLHVTVPVPPTDGVLHVHPGLVNDWNVVLVGIGSLNVTVVAADPPWLRTTCVNVMLLPATTAVGVLELVSVTSAGEAPTVVAVRTALLIRLGSAAIDDTAAMFVTTPVVTPVFNFVTITNDALVPAAR